MKYVICHYSEIGLKGKNRKFFEEKLIKNIKRVLRPKHFIFVKRISGRIIVQLTKKGGESEKEINKALKNVFGMAYFSLAVSSPQKIKSIREKALEILRNLEYHKFLGFGYPILQSSVEYGARGVSRKFKTFRISTQRSKKDFYLTSQQINEKVGEYILQRTENREQKTKFKVDLERPDMTCFIEIVEKYAFLYLKKIRGLGGLPVSVSGKAIVLLSGGIDSPVAGFLAMKRGIKAIFLHFHARPFTSEASIEKAKRIVELLSKYQGKSKLYLIPFAEAQKEILLKTPTKLRVILYRRVMFQIAAKIAEKEKALVIFTGESVGQVASQTLENIKAIEAAVHLPVFRPLISQDKEEIIQKAKEIGTFEISILPHQDCCSRFLPRHPETRARLEEVIKAEKKLNIRKLIQGAIKKSSLIEI